MSRDDGAVGVVAGGRFGELLLRKDSEKTLEIGQLLVYDKGDRKMLFKVFDLVHSSTLPQEAIDMAQGYAREEDTPPLAMYDMDVKVSYFTRALLKPLVEIRRQGNHFSVISPKSIPPWWEGLREVTAEDVDFLRGSGTYIGKLRNGSRVMDVDINIPTDVLIPHHVLVAASTGKGKSNAVKVMLWSMGKEGKAGAFVVDPHGEYWGFHGSGLRQLGERAVLFSPDPPPGGVTLKVNTSSLLPEHFSGVFETSEAQFEAMLEYYRKYRERWLEELLGEGADLGIEGDDHSSSGVNGVRESTLSALRRKLNVLLDVDGENSPFSFDEGENTVPDIIKHLEESKVVVVDTSSLEEGAELLISNVVADRLMKEHRGAKSQGKLDSVPPVAIVIEEAARVLGEGVEPNVLERVAREGRKFKVGLVAVTQLPSMIQKELLANMNTKIILGNEARTEREALINSSAQDLSNEEEEIASLDVGEAIVTSSFLRMAVPVKVPRFEDLAAGAVQQRGKLNLTV